MGRVVFDSRGGRSLRADAGSRRKRCQPGTKLVLARGDGGKRYEALVVLRGTSVTERDVVSLLRAEGDGTALYSPVVGTEDEVFEDIEMCLESSEAYARALCVVHGGEWTVCGPGV